MKPEEKMLRERLRALCADGPVSFRDYIETVLYADGCGYYTRKAERVGRNPERDFYTAESLGPVFARLVVDAATSLVGEAQAAKSTFVEIAAEPGRALLDHAAGHPFAGRREIRRGDPLSFEAEAGPIVIFANEWLDALPFHRLVFREGRWRERGVQLDGEGALEEALLPGPSPEVAARLDRLPATAPEAYELDWPIAAESALADLVAQDWSGLLLLFDYGKSWQSLLREYPQGTARCFHRHRQSGDLLASPGEADITCDVCWDPLETLLRDNRFNAVELESQEGFLVRRAARAAERIVSEAGAGFSTDRQTLMELIHPAHMGRRFQVLRGLRA